MLYALIDAGVVFQLFTPPPGVPIEDCFTPDLVAGFVPVPDGTPVQQGWTYDGTSFAAPIASPAQVALNLSETDRTFTADPLETIHGSP